MRLKHYINEAREIDPDDIEFLIAKECKPFIKASQGKQIFRGATGKPANYKSKVYTNRRPTDTPIVIQNLFDDICKSLFGWNPRSSGLFVTGDKYHASTYGTVYTIWPIGKFRFIWSPKVYDFYSWMREQAGQFKISRGLVDVSLDKDYIIKLPAFQGELKTKIKKEYKDKNIISAIKSDQEIMIQCKEYYAKALGPGEE